MVLRGPSHERGGIPIEAEGDEIILTKGVYRDPYLRSIASDINVAAGGRKFAAGGPVSSLSTAIQTRGSIAPPTETATASEQNSEAMVRLESSFATYADKVDTWARTIKVQNVVTETEDALRTVNAIRNEADT